MTVPVIHHLLIWPMKTKWDIVIFTCIISHRLPLQSLLYVSLLPLLVLLFSEEAVLTDHRLLHTHLQELWCHTLLLLGLSCQTLHKMLISSCLLQWGKTSLLFALKNISSKSVFTSKVGFSNVMYEHFTLTDVLPPELRGSGAAPTEICLVFSPSAPGPWHSPQACFVSPACTWDWTVVSDELYFPACLSNCSNLVHSIQRQADHYK